MLEQEVPGQGKKNCKYLFGLFPGSGVLAIERVSETAGQLPQWLILGLPIHVGAVLSGLRLRP